MLYRSKCFFFFSPRSLFGIPPQFPSISKPIFSIETQPTQIIRHLPTPVEPIPTPISVVPKTSEPIIQAPPPPIARRLSMNSMDTFIDELYEQMIDSLIQDTTYQIFEYDQQEPDPFFNLLFF